MLVTNIFFFFHNVSYSTRHKLQFWVTIILPSANAFNFDKVEILPFGKGKRSELLGTSYFLFSNKFYKICQQQGKYRNA